MATGSRLMLNILLDIAGMIPIFFRLSITFGIAEAWTIDLLTRVLHISRCRCFNDSIIDGVHCRGCGGRKPVSRRKAGSVPRAVVQSVASRKAT